MNENKLSHIDAWKLNLRAWKIWYRLCPSLLRAMLSYAFLGAVTPYIEIFFSARIIAELASNRNPTELLKWVLVTIFVTALCQLLKAGANRWYLYEYSKTNNINDHIYMDKMTELDYEDVDNQKIYDLYSQVKQTENWSGYGIKYSLYIFINIINSIIGIIAGIALTVTLFTLRVPTNHKLAFLNSPIIGVGIGILMLIIAIISPICKNKAMSYWAKSSEDALLANRVATFFGFTTKEDSRAVDMRMYNQQENICIPYINSNNTFKTKGEYAKQARGAMGFWSVLSSTVSIILTCCIYLFVCLKSWAGAFGVGLVTQYIGATTQMFSGFSNLIIYIGDMRVNGNFLKICFLFLDKENNMYKGSLTTEKRSDRNYEVEYRDVSFKYPNSEQWALRHINMKFKVGSRLAVVGENGSGKTTFIKLLCRLYDPTEGEILLNGIDIKKYKYSDYIDIFSVVFQDFKLFAQPLGQNVACNVDYDSTRVEKCLIDVGFGDRLKAMPNGLNTYLYKTLDEDGIDISGGEAQKIAIARALYKDSPFIVLDEPTAALDPVSEAEIYSKFNDIVTDRTSIYISHRLSSCKFCDEIAVFHNGSVVQLGTHDSLLMDEKGKYSKLWCSQAQYYVEKKA